MGIEDVTREELLVEVVEFIAKQSNDSPGPEWFTLKEIHGKLELKSIDAVRDRMNKLVADGLFEKQVCGRNIAYYRKVKDAKRD